MKKLGLLGRNIGYSFSKNYFSEKFKSENIEGDFSYENFDLASCDALPEILKTNPELIGLNVTIPYKEEIIPFLDELSEDARKIGAVNTIKILADGKLRGENTDYYGFIEALKPLLKPHHQRALILGTGGAAKAIAFGLTQLNIPSHFVSRESRAETISYADLTPELLSTHEIIVNCTPLGTFPNVDHCPPIPYALLGPKHIAFDLIYNPEKTLFLAQAEAQGATIQNGYTMLINQAEKAWEIWNRD